MMSRSLCLLVAVVYSCLSFVDSRATFQSLIPNGQHVPSPCDARKVWMGVGHQNQAGGGPLNQFGADFKLHNYVCCLTAH